MLEPEGVPQLFLKAEAVFGRVKMGGPDLLLKCCVHGQRLK
jgi:hypothetical protein